MLLLLQCLLVSAQQVQIDRSRGVAYVPATLKAGPVAGEGQESATAASPTSHPRRALANTERAVGYCQGDSITYSGAYFGEVGSYDMAAMITSGTMANYKGCKIVGVRFALSKTIGKSKIFIYKVDSEGNAEQLVSNTVRRTAAGWNEVRLNSAQEITITGDDQYIMGFTYNESVAMVNAEEGALCFYGEKASSSYSSLVLQDETFLPLSNVSDLCVQLIVDVSSLPRKAVSLNSVLNGTSYKKLGSKMDLMMSYSNAGLDPVSSVRFGFKVDEGTPTYYDVNLTTPLAPGASTTFAKVLDMPADVTVGRHNLNIFVDKIDGNTPVATERGKLADPFVAYNESFKHQKQYVEQYNSQNSVVAPYVNDYFAQLANDPDVFGVNLYPAGQSLSVASSTYLDDLYAYTYPCFTVNRFYFGMGELHYAFDINDYAIQFPKLVYDGFRSIVDEANSFPAFATVQLSTTYDKATRQVGVDVSGDLAADAPAIFGDMALTVMLTEDGVTSPQNTYNTVTQQTQVNNNYSHDAVLRAYLTSPVGDKLQVSGNHYTAHYTYTLPATFDSESITVGAIVTKAFDEVNKGNMQMADVTNCNSVKLGRATGIEGVTSDATAVQGAADGIYTLSGMRVDNQRAQKGIFIVRQGGKSVKVVR